MKTILSTITLMMILGSATLEAATDADAVRADVASATQTYVDRLDAEQRAASDAYFEGGYWLDLWDWLYVLLIAWVLLRYGISTRMRDLGERISRFRFVRVVTYIFQYTLLIFVVSLPLVIYRGFVREHDYGLSNLSFVDWFNERLIGLGINLVLGTLAIALIYLVIRKAPKTWTLWGSVTGIVMLSFVFMISPVFISPLFNEYTSLEEGPLKEKILSLARANGVPANDVYQFDASKQSTRISANVSGLFGTTRISLNDNLLDRTSPESIEAVMGHEMGHYALNHSYKMLVSFGILMVIGFAFVRWAFGRVNRPAWGIRDVSDIAGLPLMLALFSTYLFFITPLTNSIIRINEAEADIYGLNASRQPDGFAEAILGLSEYRKMQPGYWEEVVFFDHPSGYNRIYMTMQWKNENLQTTGSR
ncbi:MAG: M48 family metallopeptidase [Gammaproteobacteria bacterium]|nr:M48 family metallopeptidase [Gammaproteobacteria bacterium]